MRKSLLIIASVLLTLISCSKDDDNGGSSNNNSDKVVGKWATEKRGSVIDGVEIFEVFYDWSELRCGMSHDTEIWADNTLIGYYCPAYNYQTHYKTTWSIDGTSLILGSKIYTIKEISSNHLKLYHYNTVYGDVQVKVFRRVE